MISDGALLMGFAALSQSLGADLLSFGNEKGFSSVSIDTREIEKGALFVALPGSTHDGHSFVEEAFKNGADAALVERKKVETFNLASIAKVAGKTLIAVDNSLKGLQDAARVYLEQFPNLVKIGITGSAGKTTTKEIAVAIISEEKNTIMNPGNYNSETGLPLAVFDVRPFHEVGIFEMGMNRRGEIAELAAVLKPCIALITNIGSSHIGMIGSKDKILEEKRQIFSQMDENGIALIPDDSPFRDLMAEGLKGKVVFYGEKSFADLGGIKDLGLNGSEITWEGKSIRFPLPGRHNLFNAFAAIAIAQQIPVNADAIRKGLEAVRALFGRSEIIPIQRKDGGTITLIQDCYNSNPESVVHAVEFCESLDWPGRRIYVIGDMKELGDSSVAAHEDIGRLLMKSKADMVYLYGDEIKSAAKIMVTGVPYMHTCDMEELSHSLDTYIRSGDMVLLKGSRSCALERLSTVLSPAVTHHNGGAA